MVEIFEKKMAETFEKEMAEIFEKEIARTIAIALAEGRTSSSAVILIAIIIS